MSLSDLLRLNREAIRHEVTRDAHQELGARGCAALRLRTPNAIGNEFESTWEEERVFSISAREPESSLREARLELV